MNEQYLKRLTKQQKLIILSAICCQKAAKAAEFQQNNCFKQFYQIAVY